MKTFLLISLFILSLNGWAQGVSVKTHTERIAIKADTSFINTINVSLKPSEDAIFYPIFYDSELEKISDIQVYFKKGKRFKRLERPVIREDDVELDHIASKKVKVILIPPETEAKIAYTVSCQELMYLSHLSLFSHKEMDTLKYQITVPNAFDLNHDIIYGDRLDYFVMDSARVGDGMRWDVEVRPVKVESDPLLYFGIYKNMKAPLMRTLVVPTAYKGREREYMNDWYLKKVETRRGLNMTSIEKINQLTAGITDSREILNILYGFVQHNFKYVAIEIGMGAFVPTHANQVFINKEGDCKDLSNFLSEALNYKGIESHIALAATFDHISDCDFPSLSSANHAICVAYVDGKPILLDPTDPVHLPETPIQSLQERSILIVNPDGGVFHDARGFEPEQNLIQYNISLQANTNQMLMQGRFNVDYGGISGNFLRHQMLLGEDQAMVFGNEHFESIFGNQDVADLQINASRQGIQAEGDLTIKSKLFSDGSSRYVFFDFLPRIIESVTREALLEGTHLGSSFKKKVSLSLEMDIPFESFNPIEHNLSGEGVSLRVIFTSPADNLIQCDYEFIFENFMVEKHNMDVANESLKLFKKITHEPLILKNKT